jgi:hypothetical protein
MAATIGFVAETLERSNRYREMLAFFAE